MGAGVANRGHESDLTLVEFTDAGLNNCGDNVGGLDSTEQATFFASLDSQANWSLLKASLEGNCLFNGC